MESVLSLNLVDLFPTSKKTQGIDYYDPFEDWFKNEGVCPSSHGSLKIVRNENEEFYLKCPCCEFSI